MVTAANHLDHDWWPAPIPAGVELGERSWFYSSYAFEHHRSSELPSVVVGEDTGVYAGTMFALGPHGRVRIGRYGTINGSMFATNGPVELGDHAFLGLEVLLTDSPFATPFGEHRLDDTPSPPILLGDAVWIGTGAVVLAGVTLGDGVIVGAGAVVDFDVPPYSVVAGNPARIVGEARPGCGQ
jgi:acetyltransferase-like isoleucine patch superfamily enzyme